jgi:hypothetical protein
VIVDSLTLNDLERTDLVQQLERTRQAQGGAPLRVGVAGVWTEGQAEHLALRPEDPARNRRAGDLRPPDRERLRAQHFNALSQPEKILGVRCFESLAEFIGWLRPETELDLPKQPVGFEPRLRESGIRAALQLRTGQSSPSLPSGPRAGRVLSRSSPKRTSW